MSKLDELERLSKAATLGPWKTEAIERENSDWVHFNYKSLQGYVFSVYAGHVTANKNDAELIAAMRNSIDALINVARAAKIMYASLMITDSWSIEDQVQLRDAIAELERGE